MLGSEGGRASTYGFSGEVADATGLVYLRARYYSSQQGRLLARDLRAGNALQPSTYNRCGLLLDTYSCLSAFLDEINNQCEEISHGLQRGNTSYIGDCFLVELPARTIPL